MPVDHNDRNTYGHDTDQNRARIGKDPTISNSMTMMVEKENLPPPPTAASTFCRKEN